MNDLRSRQSIKDVFARFGAIVSFVAFFLSNPLATNHAAGQEAKKSEAQIEEPKKTPLTSVTIEGMHCPSCAKKVAKKLETIKNVSKVKIDVEKSTATITAKEKLAFSPKAIWEAVEVSGYKPTKLVGPLGTFTEKPPN